MSVRYGKVPDTATVDLEPFKVSVPNEAITELLQLLKCSKLAQPTYESVQRDRKYGITHQWLQEARRYWLEDFQWREHESKLNALPHFKAKVPGDDAKLFDIHFVGVFSEKKEAMPILLLHGWPGSFLEFIPLLTQLTNTFSPSTLPYHLIVPSLPGYVFSEGSPLDREISMDEVADIFDRLAVGLGFGDGYVVQGGDIGSKIGRIIAAKHSSCKALHINFCLMPEPSGGNIQLDEDEKRDVARVREFVTTGSGYALEQGTRPSTIGLVLTTSPLALLAWIGEKFLDWSDQEPSLETIVESVALYWLTETFPTSLYPYRQHQMMIPGNMGIHENPEYHVHQPLGYSLFRKELSPIPAKWVATTGNLVFVREHASGGHFAALERPSVLLKDIEDFVAQVWPNVG